MRSINKENQKLQALVQSLSSKNSDDPSPSNMKGKEKMPIIPCDLEKEFDKQCRAR